MMRLDVDFVGGDFNMAVNTHSIYVELPREMNMPNMWKAAARLVWDPPPELGKRCTLRSSKEQVSRGERGEVQPMHVLSSPSGRESPGPRRRFHGRRQRLGAQVRGRSLPEQVQNQSEENPRVRPS